MPLMLDVLHGLITWGLVPVGARVHVTHFMNSENDVVGWVWIKRRLIWKDTNVKY